ncbi:MAG: hypothetical protein ACREA2_12235 [Blastocatellia bacterium]
MLERTYIPLGSGRLQREILVVPPKKESVRSGPLPQQQQYEQEANPPVTVSGLLNPPATQKIKRVIAELEKRRAELFTMALEATARAQEAEQKRAEAEAIARAAIEKVHKMEALFLGAEANTYQERRLVFGLLVFANDKTKANARKAVKRRVAAEATLNGRRQPAFLEFEAPGKKLGGKLKFVIYSLVVTLLLLGVGSLFIEAFF